MPNYRPPKETIFDEGGNVIALSERHGGTSASAINCLQGIHRVDKDH